MLTPLGKAMSAFPISPRHSRMLLEALSAKGTNANCLRAAVAVTAVLSLESPFLSGDEGSQQVRIFLSLIYLSSAEEKNGLSIFTLCR